MSLLAEALAAHAAGVCVLPPKQNGTKAPLVAWTEYQSRRSTPDEIRRWYGDGRRTGLGVVLGAISGNLELLEFDDVATYGRFKALAETAGLGELVDRIEGGYLEHSPNGIHWLYRCEEVGTNTKLARRPEGEGVKVLVETRGEGGFAIVAPTYGDVHPSGRSYDLKAGGWADIATISTAERDALFDLARTLDSMPRREQRSQTAIAQPRTTGDEERPGDWFNRTRRWDDVLGPHGWTFAFEHRGEGYWRRPGKDHGQSATTNYADSDLLKVFSSSTPFDTETAYTKFAAYAVLEHGGDFSSAASALVHEMPERARGSSSNTPPPLREPPPEDDEYIGEWDETEPGVPPDNHPEKLEIAKAPALLEVRTVVEAIANPPVQPETLVHGMLRQGELCVLGAPRAIGKSWFGMNLAVLAGRGSGLLAGNLAVAQKCTTLYCQGELDRWESYRRWYMLGAGVASQGVVETFERWRLRVVTRRGSSSGRDAGTGGGWAESEEHMDAVLDGRLEATIAAYNVDIVIIDPWAVYYAGKENSNDEVEAALDKLRDLAMRYGTAIVILHHLGKSTEGREPEDLWRGASRLPDWASTRITMLPHYTDRQAVEQGMTRAQARRYADVFFLRRSDPTEGFSMALDAKTGWWERWDAPGGIGAAQAVEMAPVDVAELCRESGGWASLRAAAMAMDVAPHTAEKLLGKAIKAGLIVELAGPNKTRRFSLPGASSRPSPDPDEDF